MYCLTAQATAFLAAFCVDFFTVVGNGIDYCADRVAFLFLAYRILSYPIVSNRILSYGIISI